MYEKTNVDGIVKDKNSGALINTKTSELNVYRKKKKYYRDHENMKMAIAQLQNYTKNLEERIEMLEKEME